MAKYAAIVQEFIDRDAVVREAFDIVRSCAMGGCWLIGGAVYQPIIQALYGGSLATKDVDVLVEKIDETALPHGWERDETRLGGLRLRNGGCFIDVVTLQEIFWFDSNREAVIMAQYLDATPLTVQSIYFDLKTRELRGSVAFDAIRRRRVGAHCVENLMACASLKAITPNEYIMRHAEKLAFTPILL